MRATDEYRSAEGTPTLVARPPHTALPTAIPPCRTSRYMDNARARNHGGDIVCAATFRQARIPIHAIPLANNTRLSAGKVSTLPAAKLIAANSRVPNTTSPSTDNLLRNRGNAAAPASAPRPKDPSNNPYPVAP